MEIAEGLKLHLGFLVIEKEKDGLPLLMSWVQIQPLPQQNIREMEVSHRIRPQAENNKDFVMLSTPGPILLFS